MIYLFLINFANSFLNKFIFGPLKLLIEIFSRLSYALLPLIIILIIIWLFRRNRSIYSPEIGYISSITRVIKDLTLGIFTLIMITIIIKESSKSQYFNGKSIKLLKFTLYSIWFIWYFEIWKKFRNRW